MLVDDVAGTFKCFSQSCGKFGDVVDLIANQRGMDSKDVFKEFAEYYERDDAPKKQKSKPVDDFKLVASYEYKDENGEVLYTVERHESKSTNTKTFKQWHSKNGSRVNNMKGVRRVLYRLPEIMKADEVFIAEGEKCVAALIYAGYENATTNCGGSGGWLDSYADLLKDKRVVIFRDSDDAGKKWCDAIKASLEGKIKTLRIIKMPDGFNDVADLCMAHREESGEQIAMMVERSEEIHRGVDLPIFSSREMTDRYIASVRYREENNLTVNFGKWLPSLGFDKITGNGVRPLVPGDLVTIMGGTGTGKTGMLQNLAIHLRPIPILMFEIELADDILTERFHAAAMELPQWQIEDKALHGVSLNCEMWDHIFTCPESKLTPQQIEEYIRKSELKIGQPPLVVLVDYIGLVSASGSRYERTSTIAEDLKRIAKATNTVIVMASQVARADDDRIDVRLHDAKDSGSIENSSGLVLGAWRTGSGSTLRVKVLKSTKGGGGIEIDCNMDGKTMTIKEMAREW